MDSVIKYEKTQYGRGLLFFCNGLAFKLIFDSDQNRDEAINQIEIAISVNKKIHEIPIEAKTE